MKTILSQLKSTEDAIEFGKNASRDELQILESLREMCGEAVKRLMEQHSENDDDKTLEAAVMMGTKAQFCREALEVANGSMPAE